MAQERYSLDYKFTMDPSSLTDIVKLKELRKTIKAENTLKKRPAFSHMYPAYVKCQGRGFRSPAIQAKYRKAAKQNPWKNAYQCILLDDAATWDVYVYPRYSN